MKIPEKIIWYSHEPDEAKSLSEIQTQADGKVDLDLLYMVYKGAGREGNCMFKYNGAIISAHQICVMECFSHIDMVLDSLDESHLAAKAKNPETI